MNLTDNKSNRFNEQTFLYKLPVGVFAAVGLGSLLFFGGLGAFLIAGGVPYSYIGYFSISLGVAIFVGEFLEWKHGCILVSTDAVWVRNFLKIERCYPWEKCYSIYKKRCGAIVEIYVHLKVRVPTEKRRWGQKEVKEVWTTLPWSFMSTDQKERLLRIIADSKLASEIKESFLESVSL